MLTATDADTVTGSTDTFVFPPSENATSPLKSIYQQNTNNHSSSTAPYQLATEWDHLGDTGSFALPNISRRDLPVNTTTKNNGNAREEDHFSAAVFDAEEVEDQDDDDDDDDNVEEDSEYEGRKKSRKRKPRRQSNERPKKQTKRPSKTPPKSKTQVQPNDLPAIIGSLGDSRSNTLEEQKLILMEEAKNVASFVVIGQTLHRLYYEDKLMKNQREFLEWTKRNLGFSKSTTYEYIVSYRVYNQVATSLDPDGPYEPPIYQSHCQLLARLDSKDIVQVWKDVCDEAEAAGVTKTNITTTFLETYLESKGYIVNTSKKSRKTNSTSTEQESSASSARRPSTSSATTTSTTSKRKSTNSKARTSSNSKDSGVASTETSSSSVNNGKRSKYSARTTKPKSATAAKTATATKVVVQQQAQEEVEELEEEREMETIVWTQAPTATSTTQAVDELVLEHNGMEQTTTTLPHDHLHQPLQPLLPANILSMYPVKSPSYTGRLPIDESEVFEYSKNVVAEQRFDMVLTNAEQLCVFIHEHWYGRVWADLTAIRPVSNALPNVVYETDALFSGGLERLLQLIFLKFSEKQFQEGVFLLRGEFGAPWFTPIMQYPHCILSHQNIAPLSGSSAPTTNTSSSPSQGILEPYMMSSTAVPAITTATATTKPTRPSFDSYVVFYLGPNVKEFCTIFQNRGIIPGLNSWSAVTTLTMGMMGVSVPGGGDGSHEEEEEDEYEEEDAEEEEGDEEGEDDDEFEDESEKKSKRTLNQLTKQTLQNTAMPSTPSRKKRKRTSDQSATAALSVAAAALCTLSTQSSPSREEEQLNGDASRTEMAMWTNQM